MLMARVGEGRLGGVSRFIVQIASQIAQFAYFCNKLVGFTHFEIMADLELAASFGSYWGLGDF